MGHDVSWPYLEQLQYSQISTLQGRVKTHSALDTTQIGLKHSLSQQGVWVLFGHRNPTGHWKKTLLRTPKFFCAEFLEMLI